MSMVKSRNLASYTYDEETVEEIVDAILGNYIYEFEKLEEKLNSLKQEEINNQ